MANVPLLLPDTVLKERYLIRNLLGKGGMGAVYIAEDLLTDEEIAVKQTFFGDQSELRDAFFREARLLAWLSHPALPKVTDYFADNTSQFLVMELIHGEDLSNRFDLKGNGEPMLLEDALKIAEQLFEVLEYLHSRSIIHRDLKPANLKLTNEGQLKVLDFGAAKGRITETTVYSVPVYTPGYAPREQIYRLGTNEFSDVFSAAVTIYHLLAGEQPPNVIKREDIIRTKKLDPLRPLHELNAKVAPQISEVLQKAMSLFAEERLTAKRIRHYMRDILEKILKEKQKSNEAENSKSFEDFAAILEKFDRESTIFYIGELVTGIIDSISEKYVFVDFKHKTLGTVPIEEFGSVSLMKGDKVEVVIRNLPTGDFSPVLSYKDALHRKSLDRIEKAYTEGISVRGFVVNKKEGSLIVDIDGIEALLPISLIEMDFNLPLNLDFYKGQEVKAKIIKFNRRNRNIILSRQKYLEEQAYNTPKPKSRW